MEFLVELHNQYVIGLITFAEYQVALIDALATKIDRDEVYQELVTQMKKLTIAEHVEFQNKYGILGVDEYQYDLPA